MPVTLSIKNVPDRVVERLRLRAKANRRSLQGELLAMVERSAAESGQRPMTITDLYDWAKAQGFRGTGRSVDDIRRMRDERSEHLEKVLESARATHQGSPHVKSRGRR